MRKGLLFSVLIIISSQWILSGKGIGVNSAEMLNIGVGARQIGMGETGVISRNGAGIWWNPGNLGLLGEPVIDVSHTGMYKDISGGYISGGWPVKGEIKEFGVIGVGIGVIGTGEIQKYSREGYEEGKMNTSFKVIEIGYGKKIEGEENKLSIGIGIKSISDDLGEAKGKGIGIDFGWIYTISGGVWSGGEPVEVGMSFQNISGGIRYESERFPLGQVIRVGSRWAKEIEIGGIDTQIEWLKEGYLSYFKFGIELNIKKIFSIRMGYKTGDERDLSNGMRFGIGVKILNMDIDYGYSGYGELGEIHRISIGIRFGKVVEIEGIKPGIDPDRAFRKGMKYYKEGKYAEAILEFNKVLDVEPLNEEAFEMMKKASEKMSQEKEK